MNLLQLAERVEGLTGPDREVDLAIWRLVDPRASEIEAAGKRPLPWLHCYTSSLDAAMTLVPADHTIQLSDWEDKTLRNMGPWQAIILPFGSRGRLSDCSFTNRCEHAQTLPLAIVVAALRARTTSETSSIAEDE